MKNAILWLLLLAACTPAAAARHQRRHRDKLPTLFPTAGSLLAQNAAADRMGLPRVKNRAMLGELVSDGSLVSIPASPALRSSVKPWRAFLTGFAVERLADISKTFYGAFGKPLTVDSAVRPLDVQRRLWRSRMVPAAPPYGPTASVHPTGAAFDIGKRSLTKSQLLWMEWRLFYLQQIGWVITEEERNCFHVVAVREDARS